MLYRILLFVHVLGAAAWAGGALYAYLQGLSVRASGDPARMAALGRETGEFGGKFFAPAAVLTVLAGIWLVIEGDWGFDHFWILSAFAVWIYSIVSNVTWMAKLGNRMVELQGSGEAGRAEMTAASIQMFRWRTLEVALLVYVLFAMTYKPFA